MSRIPRTTSHQESPSSPTIEHYLCPPSELGTETDPVVVINHTLNLKDGKLPPLLPSAGLFKSLVHGV